MINKKKRKLRAPIVSLSDTQFLLNTPINRNEQTPKRISHQPSVPNISSSILNRQTLTYTPMTRRLLEKQQQFICTKSFKRIAPSISSTNINNNANTKRKKKRKYAEIQQDISDETPIIPGSVRKKRRLSTSSAVHNKHCTKYNKTHAQMTNSAKQKVMKKVLNNEYNPSLSLSSDISSNNSNSNSNSAHGSIDLLIDYESLSVDAKANNENNNKMVLDFDTPSKSASHTPKKRRLSSGRDIMKNITMIDRDDKEGDKCDMVSRRRRKRHSLSSAAIKKINNKRKQRSRSPFQSYVKKAPNVVKKTYASKGRERKAAQHMNHVNITSLCPLITKIQENKERMPSQIGAVCYECFDRIYNGNISISKGRNIFRKMDRFLCLLCRAEIMLQQKNEESGNIGNRNNKKRVRFCCYDLSTVNTPQYGELDSVKELDSMCRLLVECGKIGSKLFSIKSEQSITRKSMKMFMDELHWMCMNQNQNHNCDCVSYLFAQFRAAANHEIAYPFCEKVSDLLSSSIRFYLKTIFNASEFVNSNSHIIIPAWYNEIGTFSINQDTGNRNELEFIPYHAAEISINLESYHCLKDDMQSIQENMEKFAINDNPMVFFNEMKQVLLNIKHSIYGSNKHNANSFEKYLFAKWKKLKLSLKNVKCTTSHHLYFYLPLLDFDAFLNKI